MEPIFILILLGFILFALGFVVGEDVTNHRRNKLEEQRRQEHR